MTRSFEEQLLCQLVNNIHTLWLSQQISRSVTCQCRETQQLPHDDASVFSTDAEKTQRVEESSCVRLFIAHLGAAGSLSSCVARIHVLLMSLYVQHYWSWFWMFTWTAQYNVLDQKLPLHRWSVIKGAIIVWTFGSVVMLVLWVLVWWFTMRHHSVLVPTACGSEASICVLSSALILRHSH